MYIKEVEIVNVGPIINLNCKLEKDKLNFIIGEAGSGKTTFSAIVYEILKRDSYLSYEEKTKKIAKISLTIETQKQNIQIMQEIQNGKSRIDIKNIINMQEQLQELTSCEVVVMKNWTMKKMEELDYTQIEIFLERFKEKITNQDLFHRIKDRLKTPEKNHLISSGEQNILKILDVLLQIQDNTIVICDDILDSNGVEITKFILEIMHELTNSIQFIITKSIYSKQVIPEEWCNTIYLRRIASEINPIFIQREKDNRNRLPLPKKKEIPFIYHMEETIDAEEDREVEYKEVKGKNPVSSIVNVAPIYIVSFLNSAKLEKGYIKWGISNDRVVKGVVLDKEQKDEIRRKISEEVKGIKPYVGADDYDLEFINVHDAAENLLTDTYIVELSVKAKKSQTYLYATSKEEIYIKTNGGKRKLNSLEIQAEIKNRVEH